jgi:putative DNA primase/helicase
MRQHFDDWKNQAARARLEDLARQRGWTLKRRGAELVGPCPRCGGDDRFSINPGKQLWNCRHCDVGGSVIDLVKHIDGCDFIAACETLTREPPPKKSNGKDTESASTQVEIETYDYTDNGNLLFQGVRLEFRKADGSFVVGADGKRKKTFKQRRPDPDHFGQWIWKVGGIRPVPYRLEELCADLAEGRTVLLVEGERKVNLLRDDWNVPATCCAGGSGKWREEHSAYLRGADVVLVPDNDDAGYHHADAVGAALQGIASRVRVLQLPHLAHKGDIVDWKAAGHSREELDSLIAKAPDWKPQERAPEFSDQALALQFAALHQRQLQYVAEWSRWYAWDGKLWKIDSTLAAFDRVKKICRDVANSVEKPATKDDLASAKTVAAVERLARSDRRLAATIEQWNSDLWLLNAQDGCIDLKTGDRWDHAWDFYHTKITTVAAEGECPLWMAFLRRVTNDDAELIEFLQRYLGYSLTGEVSEHVFVFLYGTGGNGKSVFINAVSQILGDYAVAAPMDMFLATHGERHPTDIAMLHGARLVTAQETPHGRRWDEAKVKNLTGGDRLKGRFMRQDFFEFSPTHKLLMAGNEKPSLHTVDEAIRRRVLLVPFVVHIPEAERDKQLLDKLRMEHGGILRWMVEGCLKWQADGLKVPAAVRAATDDYLTAEDDFGQWLEECVEATRHDPDWASLQQLFASWRAWCERRGFAVGTVKGLAEKLGTKFLKAQHPRTRVQGFRRLKLKEVFAAEPELELEPT